MTQLTRRLALGLSAAITFGLLGAPAADAQQVDRSPTPPDIFHASPVELPPELLLKDGTGSAAWREQVMAIHGDDDTFAAGARRGRGAHGLSTALVGRNVLVLEDEGDAIHEANFAGLTGNQAMESIASQLYSQFSDDYDFIMVMLDWTVRDVFAYYMPLANDVQGIGAQRLPPYQEYYDETDGPLNGYIFMNNWRTYLGQNAVLGREVFLQEIGHRWGAFVYYDKGEGPSDALLGRDLAHWSYFMHSSNSALEGNDWRDNEDGTFSTLTSGFRISFSPLDRYLMGLIPSEDVPPFFYIADPDTGGERDERGQRLNPASPPENAGQLRTFPGQRVDVTIEDVVAAEGTRLPTHTASKRQWRMATVLVLRSGETLSEERLELVDQLVDDWRMLFEEETSWEMDLITALDGMEEPNRVPFGEVCEASGQCNPDEASSCVAPGLTGDKVCTYRCVDHSECGEGFCCLDPSETGNTFCLPADDACPDVMGEDEPDEPDTSDEDSGEGDEGEGNEGEGDEEAEPQVSNAAGGDSGGCGCAQVSPQGGALWPGALAAALLALVALARRRA